MCVWSCGSHEAISHSCLHMCERWTHDLNKHVCCYQAPVAPTTTTPGSCLSKYLLLVFFCWNRIITDSVHQFWLCYWDLIGCAGDRLGRARGPFVTDPSVGDTRVLGPGSDIEGEWGRDDRTAGWTKPKPPTPLFDACCDTESVKYTFNGFLQLSVHLFLP